MSELALHATDNGDAAPYGYGADPNAAATWDADKVYGCLCDEGFDGYDCSRRTCAYGNDITLQEWDATALNEAQSLVCTLLDGSALPTFRLEFRQAQTADLAYDVTVADLQDALEGLATIGRITVEASTGDPATTAVCATTVAGPAVLTFNFETEHGDVPPLRVVMDDAARNADGSYNAGLGWMDTQLEWTGGDPADAYVSSLTYTASPSYPATGVRARETRKGRSGNAECSGRGLCNRSSGTCECFPGFGASDGNRGPGAVEDCGWREPYAPRSRS
jgi:hypothetical protein